MNRDQNQGATLAIAHWLGSLKVETLPDEVLHHARRLLLDHLAAVVVGAATEVSEAVLSVASETYLGDQATVVCGGRLAAAGAAFVNGSAAHGFELDDGYTPGSVHPGAVVLPAVLAAAERGDSSFEQMLLGTCAGYELTCRIAEAGHPATWRNGFHNTPIAGVFGAAGGVSALLGLDEEVVGNALGIAGSHSGGLFAFLADGSEVKRVHAGKAARDGLMSVDLARLGLTGPTDVLEGEKGYFAAFARGDWDESALLNRLGVRWVMLDTYIKPYPCCRHLHGPIDAVLDLARSNHVGVGEVRKVTVQTYEVASRHSHTKIENILDAQMSIPFVVAMALRDHEIGLDQFEPSARSDPKIRSWLGRVEVAVNPQLDSEYPRTRPALVTLDCHDGRVLTSLVEQPWGEPSNPLSDDAVAAKARDLCSRFIGADRAEALISQVMDKSDLHGLMADLANPRSKGDTPLRMS